MSLTVKRIVITCSAALGIAFLLAAAAAVWYVYDSKRDYEAEELAAPVAAQDARDVDAQLWKVCLAIKRGNEDSVEKIAAAYAAHDKAKLDRYLAKQYELIWRRGRKQLDLITADDTVGYKDEALLLYAYAFRIWELSHTEIVQKRLSELRAVSDFDNLPDEYKSCSLALLSSGYRCAAIHGGYLLWSGNSDTTVQRDLKQMDIDADDIEEYLNGARLRKQDIERQIGSSGKNKDALWNAAELEKYYNEDYPSFYRIPEDRMWNWGNYLAFSTVNYLWWEENKPQADDGESQKELRDWLAADLAVYRKKIAAVETERAAEMKKAALAVCAEADVILKHADQYGSGDNPDVKQILRADSAKFEAKRAALYQARRDYVSKMTKDDSAAERCMVLDGIGPVVSD